MILVGSEGCSTKRSVEYKFYLMDDMCQVVDSVRISRYKINGPTITITDIDNGLETTYSNVGYIIDKNIKDK